MSHDHSHAPANFDTRFRVGIGLNVAFIVIEVAFGIAAGSLALLADAGHNLTDVLGLGLAWGGAVLARREPTERRTYGMRRGTILAALSNALLLLITMVGITWEAIDRFGSHSTIQSWTIVWVAAAGVVLNGATAWLFQSGRKGDVNVRGAFTHMAADALVSLGVVIGGVVIALTGLAIIDPILSLIIVAVIAISTWGLLRDSVNLALDAVPEGIDLPEVERYLSELPGVEALHDLHIWPLSTTETALTAHLVKPDPTSDDELLDRVTSELHERFHIGHTTIQWERQECAAKENIV